MEFCFCKSSSVIIAQFSLTQKWYNLSLSYLDPKPRRLNLFCSHPIFKLIVRPAGYNDILQTKLDKEKNNSKQSAKLRMFAR